MVANMEIKLIYSRVSRYDFSMEGEILLSLDLAF